jgi:hypothetical protein
VCQYKIFCSKRRKTTKKKRRFLGGELYFIFLSFVLGSGFFSPTITNKTPRGKPKELEIE